MFKMYCMPNYMPTTVFDFVLLLIVFLKIKGIGKRGYSFNRCEH